MGAEREVQSMAARGRQSNDSIPLNVVLRVLVSLLVTLGFLLYLSVFIGPKLLGKMMSAIVPCNKDDDQFGQRDHVMLSSTAELSNAMDADDMRREHSRLERRDFEDPTTELPISRNDLMNTKAAGSNIKAEAEEQTGQEFSGFPKHMSKLDGRSTRVNCCSCEPKQIDKNSNHDLNHRSKNNSKNFDDQIIMQEGRMERERIDDLANFTIMVGVMTMASKIDRRNLLRLAYGVQSSKDARISVRFVIGGLLREGGGGLHRTLLGMENATYGDIILLNCLENLNEGKTFTFFSSLPDRGLQYDYVMKTDDDSYIRFENLGRSLKPLSRTDLYYGYILPCENEDPYAWYMAGMGYLISWDLVLWIRDSPIARNTSVGTEDQLVGNWFNEGGVAKHRVNEKPLFYDHPEFGGKCSHELIPETILVHQVKTPERWMGVLDFFEGDRISRALSLS